MAKRILIIRLVPQHWCKNCAQKLFDGCAKGICPKLESKEYKYEPDLRR